MTSVDQGIGQLIEGKPDVARLPSEHEHSAELSWGVLALGIPAFLFATGFIVISENEQRLGLVASDPDLFKAHYLQVGFLCASFIAMLASLGFFQAQLARRPSLSREQIVEAALKARYRPGFFLRGFGVKNPTRIANWPPFIRYFAGYPGLQNPDGSRRFQGSHLLVAGPVLAGLYLRLTLCPPDTFRQGPIWFLLAFCVVSVVFGSAIVRVAAGRAKAGRRPYLGVLKLVPIGLFSMGVAYLGSELSTIRWADWDRVGDWLLAGVVIVSIAWLLGRLAHRLMIEVADRRGGDDRRAWIALCGLLGTFLYYVLATAYSAFWYPHIPLRKGGADYTDAACSTVQFNLDARGVAPPELQAPLVLLLETSETYYFAPNSADKHLWGKGRDKRPAAVYSVSKASVLAVTTADPCIGIPEGTP